MTTQIQKIDLSKKDKVDDKEQYHYTMAVKSKAVDAYKNDENALDLTYNKGAGIDVRPENVDVWLEDQTGKRVLTIDKNDYKIEIDSDGICRECRTSSVDGDVGTGRHVHAGKHVVKVIGVGNCDGFQEVEFTIEGVPFETGYKAYIPEGTEGYKNPVMGKKVKTGEAPHNFVKVLICAFASPSNCELLSPPMLPFCSISSPSLDTCLRDPQISVAANPSKKRIWANPHPPCTSKGS